jgi:hypothetical protein
LALRTLAVARIVIVTGSGPHEKVMIPPAATAATTASEVQLAAVPLPTTRVGREVSTAAASGGTAARPFGLPAGGTGVDGRCDGLGDGAGDGAVPVPAEADAAGEGLSDDEAAALRAVVRGSEPQPAAVAVSSAAMSRAAHRFTGTGRC